MIDVVGIHIKQTQASRRGAGTLLESGAASVEETEENQKLGPAAEVSWLIFNTSNCWRMKVNFHATELTGAGP